MAVTTAGGLPVLCIWDRHTSIHALHARSEPLCAKGRHAERTIGAQLALIARGVEWHGANRGDHFGPLRSINIAITCATVCFTPNFLARVHSAPKAE